MSEQDWDRAAWEAHRRETDREIEALLAEADRLLGRESSDGD